MKITPKSVHVLSESVRLVWTDEKTEQVKQIVIHNADSDMLRAFMDGASKGLKMGTVTFEWAPCHGVEQSRISTDSVGEKKKWRWHKKSYDGYWMILDGERIPAGRIKHNGDDWVHYISAFGWVESHSKESAIAETEKRLRESEFWREGDEIEPYKEPVPTLEEWLSVRNIRLVNGLIWRNGDTHVGINAVVMKYAHDSIAEYFAKYPDAEPELRKVWEK